MPQDFSGKNLRGKSFKGQNLEGANFRYADIRGADFSNANLRGAKFTGAKAGLQNRWTISLVIFSLLLSAVSGFISAVSGAAIGLCLISGDFNYLFAGVVSLVVLVVFLIVAVYQNLVAAFRFLLMAGTIAVVVAVAGALTAAVVEEAAVTVAAAVAVVGIGFLATGVVVLGAVAVALSGLGTMIGAVVATVTVIVTLRVAVVVKAVTATGAMILARAAASAGTVTVTVTMAGAVAGAVAVAASSAYVGWCALVGDEKQVFIRNIAVAIATTKGTNYQGSNVTDADFTQATLKNANFKKANLTCTCWFQAHSLHLAAAGKTYLKDAQVRQLIVTKDGQNKNFNRQNLRRVNLKGANLADASFIGADLSAANLQDADLSRAKLVHTQLDKTDLTGATLTGAYIEGWNITHETKFTGVRCEYVYMRLPTKINPDPLRKPDNREEVFKDGDFADFIQPIFDTLDLYHNQGVDPRAIAISFKQLAENHPDAELEIVAMEKRGDDKFLLRARTASQADKSELSAEYFDTYNQIKGLPEREIRLLLSEKDNQIRRLENMVTTALERPNFYSNTQVGTVSTMTSNPGGFSVGGSVGGNVNNVQGDNNRAVQGDNNQAVLGDNNQVTQQNQVGEDNGESLTKEDVVKLLAQLETLIQGAELPAETKEEVIEDLDSAKKATDKEEPKKNIALANLESVAETLEKTSKGVDAGQKIWTTAKPIIVKVATWLGAAAGSHLLGL
jgi:uncharacterized protein YjbI with pentapeptide repeats